MREKERLHELHNYKAIRNMLFKQATPLEA